MLHTLASRYTEFLISRSDTDADPEILTYGFECLLSELICDALAFGIAFWMGRPLEMLIWQGFWLPLRLNAGGHHARSHLTCIACSTALAVGCVWLGARLGGVPWVAQLEAISSICIIFAIAPTTHPHKPIAPDRQRVCRRRARVICLVEAVCVLVLRCTVYAQVAALGTFTASILCLIGRYTNRIAYDGQHQ